MDPNSDCSNKRKSYPFCLNLLTKSPNGGRAQIRTRDLYLATLLATIRRITYPGIVSARAKAFFPVPPSPCFVQQRLKGSVQNSVSPDILDNCSLPWLAWHGISAAEYIELTMLMLYSSCIARSCFAAIKRGERFGERKGPPPPDGFSWNGQFSLLLHDS